MQQIDVDVDDETYERLEKCMISRKMDSIEQTIRYIVELALKHEEKLEKMN